jgi:hypothetical protein
MKNFLFIVLIFNTLCLNSQINLEDSTVQAITYWEIGEVKNYSLITEKKSITDTDTTVKERTEFNINVKVLDSSDTSYTIEWNYTNSNSNSSNKFENNILNCTNGLKVVYLTTEMGEFIEVLNWKEVRNYIQKSTSEFKELYKNDAELLKVIVQVENTFSSKEAIEQLALKDIQLFHSFYGAQYKLNEKLSGSIQVPNYLGGSPFDAELSVALKKIDEIKLEYDLELSQKVNVDQVIDAMFSYFTNIAKTKNIDPPKREDFKNMKNEMILISRFNDFGWVIECENISIVNSENMLVQVNKQIRLK